MASSVVLAVLVFGSHFELDDFFQRVVASSYLYLGILFVAQRPVKSYT